MPKMSNTIESNVPGLFKHGQVFESYSLGGMFSVNKYLNVSLFCIQSFYMTTEFFLMKMNEQIFRF